MNCVRIMAIVVALVGLVACGGPSAEESLAAAKGHLAKRAYAEAIIELKNSLQAKPDLAEARLLLGKALLSLEDDVGAAVELGKAFEMNVLPPDEVVPPLARALLRTGQAKKVVELDQSSRLTQPEAVADLKTNVAKAYGALADPARAATALADALRAKPDYAPAQLVQARGLAGANDLGGARALVDGVLARVPADADALKLKGDLILVSGGTAEAAVAEWRKALAADPRHVSAHSALIQHALVRNDIPAATAQWEALKKERPRHLQTRYFEARLSAQKGDLRQAEEQTQLLLKVVPQSHDVLQLAGAVALQRGDLLMAEQHLGRLQQLVPEAPGPRQMLARVHLRAGEPAKALAILEPLLEAASPSAETLSLAGSAGLMEGDSKLAEQYLVRAAKLNPGDPRSRTGLAMAQIARGDAGGALSELEGIAASDAGTTADMVLISQLLTRRNWDAALRAVDRLVGKLPDTAAPLHLRGQVLTRKGDLAGARQAFEKALSVEPNYFPAIDALASIDLRNNGPDAARARIERLLQSEPKHPRGLLALASLDERAGKPRETVRASIAKAVAANPLDLQARKRLVEFHLAAREASAALAVAQEGAAAMPSSADMLALLAGTQASAGELNQSVASFNKLVSMRPKSVTPLLALAEVHLAAKSFASADEAIARALALAPDALPVIQAAVKADLAAKRVPQALKRARELQSKSPKSGRGWILEGDIGMATKDWILASAAFRTALKKESNSSVAQRLHASLRNAGDPAKADAFAAEWQAQHPGDSAFWFHLAGLSIVDKRYEQAEAQLAEVLRLAPDNAPALNNLGWVLAKQNKPGAVEKAQRANDLAPNQPAYIDTLAFALAAAGKAAEAAAQQRRAVELAPQAHALRLALARYLVQAGDKAAARKELEGLASLGDAFPQQAAVKELQAKL